MAIGFHALATGRTGSMREVELTGGMMSSMGEIVKRNGELNKGSWESFYDEQDRSALRGPRSRSRKCFRYKHVFLPFGNAASRIVA